MLESTNKRTADSLSELETPHFQIFRLTVFTLADIMIYQPNQISINATFSR